MNARLIGTIAASFFVLLLGAGSADAARVTDRVGGSTPVGPHCGGPGGYMPNARYTNWGITQYGNPPYDWVRCSAQPPAGRTSDGLEYGSPRYISPEILSYWRTNSLPFLPRDFGVSDPYYYIGLDSNVQQLEVEELSFLAYRIETSTESGGGSSCNPLTGLCNPLIGGLGGGGKGGGGRVKIYLPATSTSKLVNIETGETFFSETANSNPPRESGSTANGCFPYFGNSVRTGASMSSCFNISVPRKVVLTKQQKNDMYKVVLANEVTPSGPWTLVSDCSYNTGVLGTQVQSGGSCLFQLGASASYAGQPIAFEGNGSSAAAASLCMGGGVLSSCTPQPINKVFVTGGMEMNTSRLSASESPLGTLPTPPPPPKIPLNNPTTGCSNNKAYVTLTWSAPSGVALKPGATVFRDNVAIGSVGTGTTFTDSAPLPGAHAYFVSGADASYTVIKSDPKTITTAPGCIPAGITVELSGPTSDLKRNSQYQYTATVKNSVTGETLPISSGGTPGGMTTINFDGESRGFKGTNAWASRGLIVESGIAPSIPGDGASLVAAGSAACPGYVAPSSPSYMIGHEPRFGDAAWLSFKLKFVDSKVVDQATFKVVHGGTSAIRVQAIDTAGRVISDRTVGGPGSGVCVGSAQVVSLAKGSTTGIAEIRIGRTDEASLTNEALRTNGFGIDDLSYSQPHSPGESITWSLVNNRIGSLSPTTATPTTLSTGSSCAIGTATDMVAATVTAVIGGQTLTGTGSLPVAMQDPCATPTGTAPYAVDDQAATTVGTPIAIPVLANDGDIDNDLDPSSLAVAAQPATGTGTVTKTGTQLTYNPGAFTGPTASFMYRICDAGSRCSTASVQVTILPVPTDITYAWSVDRPDSTHKEFGDLAAANVNPVKFTTGENCTLLNAFGPVTLKLDVTAKLNGQAVTGTASKILSAASVCGGNIVGDIFGGGSGTGTGVSGLSVGRNSVVSSTGKVSVGRNQETTNTYNIENYDPTSGLAWSDVQAKSECTTKQLITQKAKTIGSSIGGTFNLNPAGASNPEGGVWYAAGDLTIANGTTFVGKGTIIAGGKVTVAGTVSYGSGGNLGVIACGSEASATAPKAISFVGIQGSSIVGAYFAPNGTIRFGTNIDRAVGLFVGNALQLDPSLTNLTILYDEQITASPPPGFSQSFVPALTESGS